VVFPISLLQEKSHSNVAAIKFITVFFVAQTHAMHVASVHHYSEANKTMEPVKGAGGVSAAPSRDEVPLAFAWADAIWADIFR